MRIPQYIGMGIRQIYGPVPVRKGNKLSFQKLCVPIGHVNRAQEREPFPVA